MKLLIRTLLISLIYITAFSPVSLFAGNDEASVTLEPRNPIPNTPVKITLTSYSINVNTAQITWTVRGKEVLKGLGLKKITLQAGNVGDSLPVHVQASTADGTVIDLDVVITPESVDLIYETPESYVPPFYEGKSLPGEAAIVKFVAMPNVGENGVRVPSSSLSYSWYVNNEYVDDASGIGRQSASFALDYLSTFTTIKVIVFGPYGTTAEKQIDVYPHDVMPLLYSYDDILGVNYTQSYFRRFQAVHDFTLSLEPYYLSMNNSLSSTASFVWALDGLPVSPLGGRLLSLRPKENSYGSKNLTISVSNKARRLQTGEISTDLVFDTR
jgi:hypothetical protein